MDCQDVLNAKMKRLQEVVTVMWMVFRLISVVGVLLGPSLLLPLQYSNATQLVKKKTHDKRQNSAPYYYQPRTFQSQSSFPRPYFPGPRFQTNPDFRKADQTNWSMPRQQTGFPNSPYPQVAKPQTQRQYRLNNYPQRIRYRDWSQKVLAANAYALHLQNEIAKQRKPLPHNQKPSQGGAEIKVFVAGVNANGKLQGEWISQNRFGNRIDQRIAAANNAQSPALWNPSQQRASAFAATSVNNVLQSNQPSPPKPATQGTTNSLPFNANYGPSAVGNTNRNSPNANSGLRPLEGRHGNLQPGTQTYSFLEKGSVTKPSSFGAVLSDNLGGAVLGPNAHSLLQSETSQQSPLNANSGGLRRGDGATTQRPKFNPSTPGQKTNINLQGKYIPASGQNKVISDQKHVVSKRPGNRQVNLINFLPQKNVAPFLPNASSLQKGGLKSVQGGLKTQGPRKGLPLDPTYVDKTTAQKLSAGLAAIPDSKRKSEGPTKPSSSATLAYKNSPLKDMSPWNSNPSQTNLDTEVALKNFLSAPRTSATNQVVQRVSSVPSNAVGKGLSAQQVIPSFPAFRYEPNNPDIRQRIYKGYRRNNIPNPSFAANNRKYHVPQHGPVPYKDSFPLMLRKISPYFKMKRNLKHIASGQAKERRRLLELQTNE
ncbi:uncharacterized protein [Montipora foliosa]